MSSLGALTWFGILAVATAASMPVSAQSPAAATNVGPGRIVCRSAASCELEIGMPASLKYKIDPAALPAADKERLVKRCTAKGAPCVATVTGTESPSVVKASSIKFHN